MNNFKRLVDDVVKKYPSLRAESTESGVTLKGVLILNAEYNEIPLYDEYEVEIDIMQDFPKRLPVVREVSGQVPKDLNHFLNDGSLCLAAECELMDFVNRNGTIVGYIDKYVMNYLYTASYFSRYKETPFGERSHGIDGIKEAYMERYECDEEEILISLLYLLVGIETYRGHNICPCGSNKKLRECHGERILADIKSKLFLNYQKDACYILSDYFKSENENGGGMNGK